MKLYYIYYYLLKIINNYLFIKITNPKNLYNKDNKSSL